ncbi:hypothetical protein P3S67_030227 [Capsicum chacoense]
MDNQTRGRGHEYNLSWRKAEEAVWPRGHGGHRFKLWKQSLAEILDKAVYNRPLCL